MIKDNHEVEIKIKLDDRESLIKKVEELGGKKTYESLEHDEYFDNDSGFYESGQVLRLRKEEKGNLLTYKGVLENHSTLLKRDEVQTYVDDEESIKIILEKLGFKPKYVKEKKVVYYQLGDIQLEFHTAPFLGEFLEIEDDEEKLKQFLPKIGLSFQQGIPKGYHRLFAEFQKANNLPDIQMTFEDEGRQKTRS